MSPEKFEQIYDNVVIAFYMAYMFNNDSALYDLWNNIRLLKAYCKLHADPFYKPFLSEFNLIEGLYKNI